jgi:osmotically inducible lipoprotein OsmB
MRPITPQSLLASHSAGSSAFSTTALLAILTATAAMTSGCAGMTEQEKATAIGAGAGAIGGSILTGGSTTGTLGGAAVGGIIGHEVNKR